MTIFEERGRDFQLNAVSAEDAIRKYDTSCKICGTQGKYLNCERCAIDYTHKMVMAVFADKANATT